MKKEDKKPDLRDRMFAPTTAIDAEDRTFVEQSHPQGSSGPDIVKPGPEVQTPGQTTKQ